MSDGKGRTHLSPMWFRASPDGGHVEINTTKGRAKDRHIAWRSLSETYKERETTAAIVAALDRLGEADGGAPRK